MRMRACLFQGRDVSYVPDDAHAFYTQWRLPPPSEYTVSKATIASQRTSKAENDPLSEVLDSEMASNMNHEGGDVSTCTASNLQTIHSLTKRLCEIDDFDEVRVPPGRDSINSSTPLFAVLFKSIRNFQPTVPQVLVSFVLFASPNVSHGCSTGELSSRSCIV